MRDSAGITSMALMTLALLFYTSCVNSSNNTYTAENKSESVKPSYKVTFIELGSVRCIPCQKMQIVMKSIETKYGDQVKVVLYDVWTPSGKL
jgi:thioredoxin 1